MLETRSWRDDAACKRVDPELFFPISSAGPSLIQAEQAKAVCRTCGVLEQCLGTAIRKNYDHGVWGATDEEERRALSGTIVKAHGSVDVPEAAVVIRRFVQEVIQRNN